MGSSIYQISLILPIQDVLYNALYNICTKRFEVLFCYCESDQTLAIFLADFHIIFEVMNLSNFSNFARSRHLYSRDHIVYKNVQNRIIKLPIYDLQRITICQESRSALLGIFLKNENKTKVEYQLNSINHNNNNNKCW